MQAAQRVALGMPGRHAGRHGRIARDRILDRFTAFRRQLAVDPGVQLVIGGGQGGAVHGGVLLVT